jgi:uncharacterized protein YqgV (UPF0045/DUF77 family)
MSKPNQPVVRAQVSVYPLRQPHLAPAVETIRTAMEKRGLVVEVGAMSSQTAGEAKAVFEALREGFEQAAAAGDVVMTVTVSNCCPASR